MQATYRSELAARGAQYLELTNGLTGSVGTQTWSIWFKRDIDETASNFLVGDSAGGRGFGFWNTNSLSSNNPGGTNSTSVYRDPRVVSLSR